MLHEVLVLHVVIAGSSKSEVSAVVSTQALTTTSQPCCVRDNNIGVYFVNESSSARSTFLATNLLKVRDAEGKLHTV